MNELPIWPPFVALAVVAAMYVIGWWESREFDRKYGRYPDDANRDPAE